MKTKLKHTLAVISLIIMLGLLIPERAVIPVHGATTKDWNPKTFWYEPWGASGVHKGIDIFADIGTPLLSVTHGLVLFQGDLKRGGKVVAVLGPKWRIHYYAHLHTASAGAGSFVSAGEAIGEVGDSGNAKGKPPHLHYAVVTLLPYFWRWDGSTQGWKKMWYLDPGVVLRD